MMWMGREIDVERGREKARERGMGRVREGGIEGERRMWRRREIVRE